jgi:hypothetical protein
MMLCAGSAPVRIASLRATTSQETVDAGRIISVFVSKIAIANPSERLSYPAQFVSGFPVAPHEHEKFSTTQPLRALKIGYMIRKT